MKPENKQLPLSHILIICFSVSAMVFAIFISVTTEDTKIETEVKKVLTVSERIESQFSWDGSHKNLEKLLLNSLNDPDSFEHIESRYKQYSDYLIVWMKFRGKNAFGGKVIDFAKVKVDFDGNILQVYEVRKRDKF